MNDVQPSSVVTVTGANGPRKIGELDKPVWNRTSSEIVELLANSAELLKKKYGEQVFQNDLGKQLKKDFKNLWKNGHGSHLFIADSDVTIAIMNENSKGLLIEIRKPGMPYQRGRIEGERIIGSVMGIKTLQSLEK